MAGLTHDKYSITMAAVTSTFVCNLMGRPTHRFHSLSLCDVAQVAIALDSAHGRSGTARRGGWPSNQSINLFRHDFSLDDFWGMGRFIRVTKMMLSPSAHDNSGIL